MKLLLCWITVHVCLCFRPFHHTMRQRVVSFHVANQTSMVDPGHVFSHVSKVKCTLICFANTSCTSVFYWKNDGKCRTTTAPQAPAEQCGHGNATIQDPKVNRHDSKSCATIQDPKAHRPDPKNRVSKQDPKGKVYNGVLRKSEQYYDFKETGLSLIHHLDNKSWHEAGTVCGEEGGFMFPIDNQKKQDAAERLVEFSGREMIFIGVYTYILSWTYAGTDDHVNYTNWAPRQPSLPFFAALSRSSGYKWVTTGQHDKASWICAKPDK